MSIARTAANFLRFIRFSHTVFALPFALGALFVAANGIPSWQICLLVLLCMVFARTAAMTFNRIADWKIDQRNPRTAARQRLAGRGLAISACIVSSLLFVATAAQINRLCLILSPVALAIVFFYSFTKRFTSLAQFFLGLALSVAPVGAWIAVRGAIELPPLILALGVLLWVAGFDMIYATQDYAIDLRDGLKSMVVALGIPKALLLACVLHVLAFVLFILFGWFAMLGAVYYWGLVPVFAALVYEHLTARRGDVASINNAFFWSNAFVGLVFACATLADRLA